MKDYPDGFERFWKAYPRKSCKVIALKAWMKLNPDKDLQEKILKAIQQQSNTPQWQSDKGQFIPYPSTWLNQERWEDEVDVILPKAKTAFELSVEKIEKETNG